MILDSSRIATLRAQGFGWKKISRELGVGVSTVLRIAQEARKSGSTNPKPKTFRTYSFLESAGAGRRCLLP